MAYVHYVTRKGLRFEPADIYCESFLDGEKDDIAKLVHEVYGRLDRQFHMQSEKWTVRYNDVRDENCLGACVTSRLTGTNLSIEIYPDALSSSSTFFEVIRHEYAHAVANLRWMGDGYFDSHSDHGRIWQQVAKKVGCRAKPYISSGEYFTHVLKDSSGNIAYYASSMADAHRYISSRESESGYRIVPGGEVYQEYLERERKQEEGKKTALEDERARLLAERDRLMGRISEKIRGYDKELERIDELADNLEKEIGRKGALRVRHGAFGEGTVNRAGNGKLDITFDSGKKTLLGLRKTVELGLISFPDSPELTGMAEELMPVFASEKGIRELREQALQDLERMEARELWTFGSPKSKWYFREF